MEQARQSGKGRVKEIFARHWEAVLICMGLVLLYNVTNYMVTSYLPTYMTVTLGENDTTAQLLVLGTMLLVVLLITTVGRTSDRWGRRPMFMAGSIALIALSYPAFLLIREGGILLPAFGCAILGMLLVMFAGTAAATLRRPSFPPGSATAPCRSRTTCPCRSSAAPHPCSPQASSRRRVTTWSPRTT